MEMVAEKHIHRHICRTREERYCFGHTKSYYAQSNGIFFSLGETYWVGNCGGMGSRLSGTETRGRT